jgi:post-segregation antitoxin (ccd killing protein)
MDNDYMPLIIPPMEQVQNVKAKINITIDEKLLKALRKDAKENKLSLSAMIETRLMGALERKGHYVWKEGEA